jgi:hypothetical protein
MPGTHSTEASDYAIAQAQLERPSLAANRKTQEQLLLSNMVYARSHWERQ